MCQEKYIVIERLNMFVGCTPWDACFSASYANSGGESFQD